MVPAFAFELYGERSLAGVAANERRGLDAAGRRCWQVRCRGGCARRWRRSGSLHDGATLPLPLEGGGWNATDLARQLCQSTAHHRRAKSDGVPGGGGAVAHAAGHPHPMRPATWTAVECWVRSAFAVQAADASPSPLQGEAPRVALAAVQLIPRWRHTPPPPSGPPRGRQRAPLARRQHHPGKVP
jgi:hypothetical protein